MEQGWKEFVREENDQLLREAVRRVRTAMEAQQPGIEHSEDLTDVMQTAFLENSPTVQDIFDELIDAEWQELMNTIESIRQVMAVRGISGDDEDSMLRPGWPSAATPVKEAEKESLKQSERWVCRGPAASLILSIPQRL